MKISICVVAYNEENNLPTLLRCIENQSYCHDKMEIILIDSMSIDDTKQLMNEFLEKENHFYQVKVFENPGKKLACGWNIALRNYTGDVIVRIDAHATIPNDFVEKNVRVLEKGEYACGGIRPNIIDDSTPWKENLLLAEQSMFGSSIASYRRSKKTSYVKSIFHGAYRREIFDTIGFYNEQLGRTEDNEIHYRMRQAGFKIYYSPDIISYQHTRSTLKGMLKQKYGNGYWVSLTLKACPGCLSLFHFVPFFFVLGIILTTILFIVGFPFLSYIMWGTYWTVAIFMALIAVGGQKKNIQQLFLPILFFLLHISYGVGSLVGMIKLPFWKYRKNCNNE